MRTARKRARGRTIERRNVQRRAGRTNAGRERTTIHDIDVVVVRVVRDDGAVGRAARGIPIRRRPAAKGRGGQDHIVGVGMIGPRAREQV